MAADADPKDRLLRAAAEMFARAGYAGASVRAIAARAETNLAAVGYHFGGKGRLYAAAVRLACGELEATPLPAAGVGPAGAWWATLLGHELLQGGPHAAEVAEVVCRTARRFAAGGPGEPAWPLLAIAGLMAVALSARPGNTRGEAEAARVALGHALGRPCSPHTPGVPS